MAEIQPIKEAQFNFLSFLWKELSLIRELQREKKYYEALINLCELISWLPEEFQNKFEFSNKSKEIMAKLQEIQSNEPIFHRRQISTSQTRNAQAKQIIEEFIPQLAVKLDQKGYMERKGYPVEHGGE